MQSPEPQHNAIVKDDAETYYIAGPMRDCPDCNFDAFYAAEELLTKKGKQSINPARIDEEIWPDIRKWNGFKEGAHLEHPDFDLHRVMQNDIAYIIDPETSGVAFLPGWEESVGASAEHAIALWANKKIMYVDPSWGYFGDRPHGQPAAAPDGMGTIVYPAEYEDTGYVESGEVRIINEETGGAKGQKLARFDLVPWDVIWKLAELYGKGAAKYDERNWEQGYDWSLSYAAAMRHMVQFWRGEDIDSEMGLPHTICAMFHMAGLTRFMETHPELDDRPKVD